MSQAGGTTTMDDADIVTLRNAKLLLENPGMATKITNIIGSPIEKGLDKLPENWRAKINEITRAALTKSINIATSSVGKSTGRKAANKWHKLAVATTGGQAAPLA